MFKQISSTHFRVYFNNKIQPFESDTLNVLEYDVLFHSVGVGIGDFNVDGFQDIFFAGNLVSSQLHVNQGDFKFQEITEKADVATIKWCTGVSVADINQDGLLDI